MKTLIDLFAGCGGLSRGLEDVGFVPVYVNELHPDALDSYLINREGLPVSKSINQSLDIRAVTTKKQNLEGLARRLRKEHGDIDLLVGGPPCQGFSGIGHRRSFDIQKFEIPSNHLYKDMSKMISAISPKAFIFENVRGLLNSRWTPDGEKGEIWEDVLRTFAKLKTNSSKPFKYNLYWELVFAKDFGVPQNRPRVILMGIREDVNSFSEAEMRMLFQKQKGLEKSPDPIELLGDLVDTSWTPGGQTVRYPKAATNSIQKYFRRDPHTGLISQKGVSITEHEYANHSREVMKKFQYMIDHDGEIPKSMQTKKFAQRLLPETWSSKGPTITATSLPDDYVHFSQPRVLTVREWARLQTFPDWYQFSGKRTTGGRNRAGDPSKGLWRRDLPKYTQIGNAVPVKLASALGRIIDEALS